MGYSERLFLQQVCQITNKSNRLVLWMVGIPRYENHKYSNLEQSSRNFSHDILYCQMSRLLDDVIWENGRGEGYRPVCRVLSTLGGVRYHGGCHDKCGGYRKYHGGLPYRGAMP